MPPVRSVRRAGPLVGLAMFTLTLAFPVSLHPEYVEAAVPPPTPTGPSLSQALQDAANTAPATVTPVTPARPPTPTAAATPTVGLVSVDPASGLPAIPEVVLAAYQSAADRTATEDPTCHLPWTLLAGIGLIESGHAIGGGSTRPDWSGVADPPIYGPLLDGHGGAAVPDTDGGRLDGNAEWDRAVGPMQFLPSSWEVYGVDADGDGRADPQDIRDATLSAARYLCAGGRDLSDPVQEVAAVFAYNHADWYVRRVLSAAAGYAAATAGVAPGAPIPPALTGELPAVGSGDGTVQAALSFAYAHLGDPYEFGGTGPYYDCSGLTQAAYAAAGILLPRTSEEQWTALPHVTDDLQRGDLVFFNDGEFLPGLPGHVGIYLGNGYMIDAPHTGAAVRIEPVAGFGTYVGAARPVALLGDLATPTAGPSPTPGATPAPPSPPATPSPTPTATPGVEPTSPPPGPLYAGTPDLDGPLPTPAWPLPTPSTEPSPTSTASPRPTVSPGPTGSARATGSASG